MLVRATRAARAGQALVVAVAMICVYGGTASAALPDGRGYEVVSPASKNGGDVIATTERTRAAADGSAVAFASLTGFGDVQGSTISSEYMSERDGVPGTSGWTVHGITPLQPPLTFQGALFALDPAYDGEMSADLARGVFRAALPITDAPNVESIINLYARDDLRTPGQGSYQLVTNALSPIAPNPTSRPYVAGASSDFSHVVFESRLNLVPGTRRTQVKLYEWADGTLRLAGVLPDDTPAPSSQAGEGASNRRLTAGVVSEDGSHVFFRAPASAAGNAYVRTDGSTTVQLNTSEKTLPESPQGASLWTSSTDGSRAFFTTDEGLVDGDDDGNTDLYMYDENAAPGHHLTLLSADGEPSDSDDVVRVVGASSDGHYVYFAATGQLVNGGPALGGGEVALYMWHDGTLAYIGAFAGALDETLNGLDAVWQFAGGVDNARVTPDGRHLLFVTRSDAGFRGRGGFAGYDHGSRCTYDTDAGAPCRELYVYSADTGAIRCASCNPTGATATADAVTAVNTNAGNTSVTSHLNHALSDDGRWVFFSTREALVPEDTNGRWDAYEYDVATGRPHLLSSGKGTDDSYFMDASASGRDAFFVTRERLVGWDVDDSYDLYDARVGGGLPDPVKPLPPCVGEVCQGPVSSAPVAGAAASGAFRGAGDVTDRLRPRKAPHRQQRAKRCRRGTRRVVVRHKVKCVRRAAVSARSHARGVRGGAR